MNSDDKMVSFFSFLAGFFLLRRSSTCGELSYLITTSILERGVTVKDLQVIVYHADHELYDEGTLIQISGRVGRKIDAYDGEVIFIASRKTKKMENAIRKIENANEQEGL